MVQRRKTAVTTCPTFSGRYPLYITNLPHFFSRVRYSRKVGQVVTRGRLPPMSRRFVCPTNRLEKWDNGGTCSLLWDTPPGARLPERLPAPAPPCVIPHRRPARAAGGGRSPRRRAAATAPATAAPTPRKRAPAPVSRNRRPVAFASIVAIPETRPYRGRRSPRDRFSRGNRRRTRRPSSARRT